MESVVLRLSAIVIGFCLDLILGDPRWMPHVVRLMGKLIQGLENLLRGSITNEKMAGILLVILASGIPFFITILIRVILGYASQWLVFIFDILLSYQLLAAKSLRDESMNVYYALRKKDILASRAAVSMIVGRDTENLDETGITKAAVETVAENTSDGVIAPIIFLALGGTPLGVFYKACNTMDSMVGYKNEKYISFGKAAAIWDDVLNFIPARLSGILMCISAFISGFNGSRAFEMFRRDRRKHKSPNAAHTEAACAGALGIQLSGDSVYFGKLTPKPTIGDPIREVACRDIPRACGLMYTTSTLALLIFCAVPALIVSIFI